MRVLPAEARYTAGVSDRISLALYHYDSCPFCVRVRTAIHKLGMTVELRNIHREPRYRSELVAATGRQTVPVLRIEKAGAVKWLPESADIVRYLYQLSGQAPPKRGFFQFLIPYVPFWGGLG